MAITRQKKEEILAELIKKFQDAKSVAFGQYAGMSVAEISDMRNKMREAGVEFRVAKKTLLRLAAKEAGLEIPDEILEGTIGAAFSYEDVVSGPKLLKTTSKEIEVVKLMGGVMDGKVLSLEEIDELASLASREELLAKFVGMMRSPLQSFYGGISSPMSSFVRTLQEYGKQLPDEGAAEPAPAEEPAVKDSTEGEKDEEVTPGRKSEDENETKQEDAVEKKAEEPEAVEEVAEEAEAPSEEKADAPEETEQTEAAEEPSETEKAKSADDADEKPAEAAEEPAGDAEEPPAEE